MCHTPTQKSKNMVRSKKRKNEESMANEEIVKRDHKKSKERGKGKDEIVNMKKKAQKRRKKKLKDFSEILENSDEESVSGDKEVAVDEVWQQEMLADMEYFKQKINLIPTSFYFDGDITEEVKNIKHHKMDHKYPGLSDKVKQKRAKFDPEIPQTVSEILEELDTAESTAEEDTRSTNFQSKSELDSVLQDNPKKKKRKHNRVIEGASQDDQIPKTKGNQKFLANDKNSLLNRGSPMSNLEELHKKVQLRLDELKAIRRGNLSDGEWMEKKRLKRKLSKQKLKMKRRSEKQQMTLNEHGPLETAGSEKKTKNKTNNCKPIFNKEGKVVYSKFDFVDSTTGKRNEEKKKTTGKNYKQLLAKAEMKKAKLEKLREKDEGAALKMEHKEMWKSALDKAEGIKVKDNPVLLKKAIKRKEKMKDRRKKKWDERMDQVNEKVSKSEDKRKQNIRNKKKEKLDKKIKKAKKKGRLIPGF